MLGQFRCAALDRIAGVVRCFRSGRWPALCAMTAMSDANNAEVLRLWMHDGDFGHDDEIAQLLLGDYVRSGARWSVYWLGRHTAVSSSV